MPSLNLCIVSREYPPETLWGGIGTFTYNLAHGLSSIGHKVDVVAFTFGEETVEEDNGINVHRIRSPKIPFAQKTMWDYVGTALSPFAFFYSIKVSKKIAELNKEKNYDVIDFPEHIGEGYYFIKQNKLPSLVRLYTPLSLIGDLGMNRTTNRVDYKLFGMMEKYSIKKATIINSPSKALADLVKKTFDIKKNIELIYNPIDTNKFSPNLKRNSKIRNVVKVLFVGALTDRKGLHILARAIPKVLSTVNNIEFTIVGGDSKGVNGWKSMKEYIVHVISAAGSAQKVKFIDRVEYDKLPKLYGDADISVVPSLYDNSPYTCLESMSCGVPVVGTSAGGMPEYIDNGINGIIVSPENVEQLAEGIITLSVNVEKRERFSIRAREKSVKEFKREVVAKKITGLYLKAGRMFGLRQ